MQYYSRLATVSVLSAFGCLVSAGRADASGFSTARFGGEHGNPVTTNPTAVYYNPAGIAESQGFRLFLDGNLAIRSASYRHTPHETDLPEPPGGEGANTDKATLFNVLGSPMIGASANFDGFALGAGFYVPFGGTSIWDKNDRFEDHPQYAGPYDGAQRWYSLNGTIMSTYYTLAAAYKIPGSGLSVGLSGNLVNSVIDTLRARNADGSNDVAGEGRSYVDASGWQVAFGAGLMYETIPKELYLGLSYQSRPNVAGGMTLKGTLQTKLGPADPTIQDIDLHQDLPDIVRFGFRYRPVHAWEFRAFMDWSRWSAFENQCLGEVGAPCELNSDGSPAANSGVRQNLPRYWKDAWGAKLGASYFFADPLPLEIMGGVGYDGNAIPNKALDPALMDFDDISLALGARYQVVEPMFASLTFTQIIYFARDTGGKNGNAAWSVPSRSPDSGGKYEQSISLVNANLEFVF